MTAAAPPLSRPTLVTRIPAGGLVVDVVTTPDERAALASDFGLPAIPALAARFRLEGRHGRIRVTGRVNAEVEQTCVVTLDAFTGIVDEPVEVEFEEEREHRERAEATPEGESEIDPDEPDSIVDGRIDLGRLTAEFLALGLDPYPKKPGATFEEPAADAGDSPFARLVALRPPDA